MNMQTRNNNIITDFATGNFSKAALGRKYGVDEKTVRRVLKNTTIVTETINTKKENLDSTMDNKTEVLEILNEEIVLGMLKYLKHNPGKLTKDLKSEFQTYVVKEVENTAGYFLITQLNMLKPDEINVFVNNMSGEFYTNYYSYGKTNLVKVLTEHLKGK